MKRWYSCQGSITGPRESNDDAIDISSLKLNRCYHLLALCDGIGGLPGSGDCSQKLVTISPEIVKIFMGQREPLDFFRSDECQLFANHLTQGFGALGGLSSHGTTFALALFSYRSALVAWAGDSRIYALMADGTFQQLTNDHHNTKGDITRFVRGNGVVVGGLEVQRFRMNNVVAIIGTSDGIHEACSAKELRRFTVYCMAKRKTKLLSDFDMVSELLYFLQKNIKDNSTFGIVHKKISISCLNSMAQNPMA